MVGGGAAGWLATLVLQDAAKRRGLDMAITVVDSSRIPTIGVGEGTTAAFRMLLRHFGFDEMEFFRETEATVKFGIRHCDWRRPGEHYDGPIDDPHAVVEAAPGAPSEYLNAYAVAAGRPLQDMHLFGHLMARARAPYARGADGGLVPLGPFHYAYHFDQALVGRFLRARSKGVEVIDATVAQVEIDAGTGAIAALLMEDGQRLAGDFFVDATGFRRRLIGEALGGKWVSYASALPVNRAMPFWIDIEPNAEIDNFTQARALDSGWLWRIPTQRRYGCGYVYNDAFLSPEEARREVEAKLGRAIDVRNDIRLDVGRLETPWMANCLAIGLSSSFLEPLEATSIHGSVVQLMMFAKHFLKAPAHMTPRDREDYNRRVGRQVDDFRTFINMHYLGGRADTPFWRDLAANKVHEETRARLQQWRREMPKREHFRPFLGGLPHVEAQLYYPVLDGLGLLDQNVARAEMDSAPKIRAFARKTYEALRKEYLAAAGKALGHAEFMAITRGETPAAGSSLRR